MVREERTDIGESGSAGSDWEEGPAAVEVDRDVALAYLRKNLHFVRSMAAKKMAACPYDMDDFIQEAYVAALKAVDIHREKNIPFVNCFWKLLGYRIKQMVGCSILARQLLENDGQAENAASEVQRHHDEDEQNEVFVKAVGLMNPKQAEVWTRLLSWRRPTTQQIAEELKVTRQTVEEHQKRGLERVRKKFSKDFLKPPALPFILYNLIPFLS